MASGQPRVLLLGDVEGNYYVISEEALQHYRVGEEEVAMIARAIERSEVSGYASPSATAANPSGTTGANPSGSTALPTYLQNRSIFTGWTHINWLSVGGVPDWGNGR